jgi:hypothetical protein
MAFHQGGEGGLLATFDEAREQLFIGSLPSSLGCCHVVHELHDAVKRSSGHEMVS